MEVIDLSHVIHDGIQIYPGDPTPSIESYITHEKDGYHVDRLILGSHTGTHIDAPYHFDAVGERIDELSIDRFVGLGILVDVTNKNQEETINLDDVKSEIKDVKKGDFVIFNTGWDCFFGTKKYLSHPYLAPELAQWLVDKDIGLVAIDALNVDPTLQDIYPVHDILMKNNILIVENLCNLNSISKKKGIFSFLPLKLQGSDGSPIRAAYFDHP